MRRRAVLQLVLATRFKAWPISSLGMPLSGPAICNQAARQGLRELEGSDPFENVVLQTLEVNLPQRYLEGYRALSDAVESLVKRRVPRVILTGMGLGWDIAFAMWAAECVERGAKFIGIQHGGTYGESVPSYGEKNERAAADLFISWGWEEDDKVVPLPATRLITMSRSRSWKKAREGILWVSTADSRYTYFLSLLPIGPQFVQYFCFQERFYQGLDEDSRRQLRLRVYPRDYGWALKNRWRDKFPELKLDDTGLPFRDSAEKVRLVVIDHFGATTFLEMLALKRPVLVFGDRDMFYIRDSAKPYHDELGKVGVLHYSPEEAARTVNEIYSKLEDWWEEPHRQEAISKFAYRFARTGKHPMREWTTFLHKLQE